MNGLYLKEFFLALIVLGLVVLITISFKTGCSKEGWVNYGMVPYGKLSTAYSEPITFYNCPEYRKPYNWPIGIKRSYPFEHIGPIMMGV